MCSLLTKCSSSNYESHQISCCTEEYKNIGVGAIDFSFGSDFEMLKQGMMKLTI